MTSRPTTQRTGWLIRGRRFEKYMDHKQLIEAVTHPMWSVPTVGAMPEPIDWSQHQGPLMVHPEPQFEMGRSIYRGPSGATYPRSFPYIPRARYRG